MKNLLLFLLILFSSSTLGQVFFTENYESGTFPPIGWTTFKYNTEGNLSNWSTNPIPDLALGGVGTAAYLNGENVANGLAEDWMVTPAITTTSNTQLRFWTRSAQNENQGSKYYVKVSKTSQTNPTTFVNVQTWDETTLVANTSIYEEKVINLSEYAAGTQIYVAFVMTNDLGHSWFIDDVSFVQNCAQPTDLEVTDIGLTSANLGWTDHSGATQWQVEVQPIENDFTGVPTPTPTSITETNPFNYSGLIASTQYKFQVRAICVSGFISDWSTPINFATSSPGESCLTPIEITEPLSYINSNNTAYFLDLFDEIQPLECSNQTENYIEGNDVFYTYTPTTSGNISVILTPTGPNSSIHIYNTCPSTAGAICLGGVANTNSNPREINPLVVTANETYYIVISSLDTTQTLGYTLIIQQNFCTPPANLNATNITTTSAELSWGTTPETTNWQYAFGPAPYGLPTGSGPFLSTNTNTGTLLTNLTPGIVYQYYVRADCNNGNYSPWSGPFTYILPQVATNLNFKDGFETVTGWSLVSGSQTNKWVIGSKVNNGGSNSLYVTDTNGASNSYANTSASIVHAYKDFAIPTGSTQVDFSFDWRSVGESTDYVRVWTVPTSFIPIPSNLITPIANSRILITPNLNSKGVFTTQNYTLNVVPYAGQNVRVVFEWNNNGSNGVQPPAAIDNVVLNLVACPKPTDVILPSIGFDNATIIWTPVGVETQWQIIVLPEGSTAPTPTTIGSSVSTSNYQISGLTSDTCYDVYIKTICSATEQSLWSSLTNFCTKPNYCNGDNFYDIGGINKNYTNNQNVSTTICANNPGDVITVTFNSFSTENKYDLLKIYDGNNTNTLLGTYSGTTLPPTFTSEASNGCLTFVFTSDNSITSEGWEASISCMPPINCLKPINLSISDITSTSATLSWVETNNASNWQVFVVPFGSPAPIFAQVGIPMETNQYIYNSLLPSTGYTFYVRSVCSTTNLSFWSSGFNFFTPPANDECINATNLMVNNDLDCLQVTSGTLVNSKASSGLTGSCEDSQNDVWYKFTATRPNNTLSLINLNGGLNLQLGLYQGLNCNDLSLVECFTNTKNIANNLVVGKVYYVRVFSTQNEAANFDFCVGEIPCSKSVSLCNTSITYPNTTNIINLGDYECLKSSPNASFFFLEVAETGTLAYSISQTSGDVDYALWGPFPDRSFGCELIPMREPTPATEPLIAYPNDPISCSYSVAATENFTLPVVQGEVYILMVTNFINLPGTITISSEPTNTAVSFCYPYNTFDYSSSTYCNSAANQTPTLLTGAIAGTYSAIRLEDGSTSAMIINPTTGEINIGASLPGTYTVTSTLIPTLPSPASNLPILSSTTVIITPVSNAVIAYSSATFCKSKINVQSLTVTGFVGKGAFFTSTPVGLENALDKNTGSIIPVLAKIGLYTVTLTVPEQGGCAAYSITTQVEILASPTIPIQSNIKSCNSYVLPVLPVGINYYTASGGTGTMLNAGELISTNQTLYVYGFNGQCSVEDSFNVTIIAIPLPTFNYLTQPTCITQTGSIKITAPVNSSSVIASNLFISEVTNANSGSLTYVEIYNGTGAAVNLANYKLSVYNNGATTPSCDNLLVGTIANNSTFVIKLSNDENIPGVIVNQTLNLCSGINNNDNIRLTTLANIVVDMWGSSDGSIFTPANQSGYTYRRIKTATPLPNIVWNSLQWTAIDPEDYSNLGLYFLNTSSYEYAVDNGAYQKSTTFVGLSPGNHSFVVHDLVSNCYTSPKPFVINDVPFVNPITQFTYNSPVCITNSNPSPILKSGFKKGGIYSYSGNGLDLNVLDGSINLATSKPGTYNVTYTISTDLENCINTNSSTTTISILAAPIADSLLDVTTCNSFQLLPLTFGNNYFTGINGTGIQLNSGDIIKSSQTLYIYSQTSTTTNCSDQSDFVITINPLEVPLFNQIEDICFGDTNVNLPIQSLNGINGTWVPAFVDTTITGNTVYTFTPDNSECEATITMTINVETCQIQKGISPNGDGRNDYLELVANKVEIFNRYGKSVYIKENYKNDWNGQFKEGGEMPDGTYYYVIELVSGETRTGWIYINREN